jgi:hypothetical protein
MSKSHGYRKITLLMALVLAAGLTLAACSSSSSSVTDDPLSHPGNDYIGSIAITVDPSAESIEITPIKDLLTDTTVPLTDPFVVTTTNQSWDGGTSTMSGDITFQWTGPERIEDLSIRVWGGDTVAQNASIPVVDDACGGDTIAVANAGGCEPGLTYVADESADGAVQEQECQYLDLCATSAMRDLRLMAPGCGTSGNSVTALWQMQEP